ncbi:fungal zn(2)-Cys(6) binuclear cluster domain-containing protein [Hirsutella rhossiliensis]|uniref:Fungal zn(2)-Cys(6) binuclear cluster domain-containing protein n=1 Tax=Hirsutella rhossiliensis TaxID=111463 RepID=A0A9P8MM82_9HYPO|nr:fungal zn(2)-Cys(6) binuclear cluster domain-containing protein [Hirsutella rhossiliensis]KAH0957645.1 fungal zn(2)-Cys(6) binuclear cluster domain-containing protein [Hirsutella rhossiliensis]
MPRRHQVRMACQRCRRKRAKCDGEDPCERCQRAGHDCFYHKSGRVSKGALYAEIERLRRAIEQKGALLDAMSSRDDADTYHMVAEGLKDGTITRQDIFQKLTDKSNTASVTSSPRRYSESAPSPGVSGAERFPMTCPHCHGPLHVANSLLGNIGASARLNSDWNSSADAQSDGDAVTTLLSIPSSPSSVPSLASSGVAAAAATREPRSLAQRIDVWTRTGWTAALVLKSLGLLLTWDYLPLCLLCKDPFLRDFAAGTGRYCSSALVNALLALATRIVNEQQHQHHLHYHRRDSRLAAGSSVASPSSPPSVTAQDWTDSQAFWNEAETLLRSNEQKQTSLPDVQALGIMALYQVSSGRESESRELAEAFAAAATDLCLQAPVVADDHGEYEKVRATTYCGAISLVRILKITTAQRPSPHAAMLQDDGVTLDQPPRTAGPDDIEAPSKSKALRLNCEFGTALEHEAWWRTSPPQNAESVADGHRLQLSSLQIIPARIFQLTEWVYKLLALQDSASGEQVVSVYRQCLNWYENFFALLKPDASNSPFILFIHIYYQFCLLSLFRRFNSFGLEAINVYPREICLQAAQSILALTQSYANLYGLWRASPLVPYFVYASGLLSVAIEEAGHSITVTVPVANLDSNGVLSDASPLAVEFQEAVVKIESDGDNMDVDNGHRLASSLSALLLERQRHQKQQEMRAPTHMNMPAVLHARLLLEEMGALYPVATAAADMLRRASGIPDDLPHARIEP